MVNPEKTFKIRNVSIRLVDIAKCYKKKEARVKKLKNSQNQFYVDKNSVKETIINNKKVSDYYKTNKII